MHPEAYRFVAEAAKTFFKPGERVLEIGSRDVNGSVRSLFAGAAAYLGTDIAPGPGVDFVMDAANVTTSTFNLITPASGFDVVVCCEVLEHTADAERIVQNARLFLRAGGHFIMTCAGPGRGAHSAVDGGPLRSGEFYRNVDEATFAKWARDFTDSQTQIAGNDLRAVCIA